MTTMKTTHASDRELQEQLLLARRVDGDSLLLTDAVLRGALDGSRALDAGEVILLRQSPLTMRRFRQLSIERRASKAAANDAQWLGSAGMLRAAAGTAALAELQTDDGHWRLHFLEHDGAWRLILLLDAAAPFAPRVLREQPMLRVVDGGGAILLQGRLDADGECESAWPFESAPAPHFQQFGARFAVEPVHP